MNALIRFFLSHELLIKIIFFGVIVLGVASMLNIQKEGFPSVSLNIVKVITVYAGASAGDVEINLTTRLEEEIGEVDGIDEFTSTSQENASTIVIQVNDDASEAELRIIVNDIQQAVDKTRDLPSDLTETPVVDVVTTGDTPILSINLSGDHKDLRSILPLLERGIESLPGVSGVDKIGYFDREVHIEVDPIKAKRLRIGLSDILKAIGARNLRTTGGTLESYLNERIVVTLNKFTNLKDVENVILRSIITGQSVKLKDVAVVKIREKDERLIVRNHGRPGMNLVVRKKSSADIIKTIDSIKRYLKQQPLPGTVSYSFSNDQSARTRLRLRVLGGNALMGFVLVAIILLFALNNRTAFWTAMSVPFSLLGTFLLVPVFGITLSAVSLAGFVLVLGMLVDDAIIVAEKITLYREQGISPQQAAVRGVVNIWKPVTVASLTTILAFSPMFAIGGMPGKFAWAIPAVVIIALSVSLFETFFILPNHLAGGKIKKEQGKPEWMLKMERFYSRTLEGVLHRRYLVLLALLVILGASFYVVKFHMKAVLFPQGGVETFYIKVELPRGASLLATEKRLKDIEHIVHQLPKTELESYATRIGHMSTEASKNRGDHHNWGIVSVYLTGEAARKRTAAEIVNDLRKNIQPQIGEKIIFENQRIGPPIGKPVEIQVISNDDRLREKVAKQLFVYLQKINGVIDLDTNLKPDKEQLVVDINYKRLAEVGLTVKDVAEALRVSFDGILVSSTTSVSETLEYRVIMDPKYRGDPKIIYRIPVKNKQGQVITLRDVLTLTKDSGPLAYHHVNGIRTETLSGDLDTAIISAQELKSKVMARFGDMLKKHATLKLTFAGESRETEKIAGGFIFSAILALALIYILVAILLDSFSQPLVIMSTIPFAIVGVIWAFFAHGEPLSFFSTMGMLGLIGVIVNDSIIMLSETKRELQISPDANLVRTTVGGAVTRLRPVLLTTITTVVGLLPTTYGIGGKDTLIIPLTMAMAYGLMFGTIITLVIVPTLTIVGHDIAHLLGRGTNHQRGKAQDDVLEN